MQQQKTERLYWTDPLLTKFEGRVLDVRPDKDCVKVILDRTAFYPESGGQRCDLGTLDGFPVTHVRENGHTIIHILETSVQTMPASPTLLAIGTTITGRVDIARRVDHSCQHTAQHIISAVAQKELGAATVGFHMGDTICTVDLDIPKLDKETLLKIERLSNEAASANISVHIALGEIPRDQDVRFKKELGEDEELRLVTIGDLDQCACCGTHVESTGRCGLIKLLRTEKVRKSTRVEFVAGMRAMDEFSRQQDVLDEASRMTGSGRYELADFLASSVLETKRLKKENAVLKKDLAGLMAKELLIEASEISDGRLVSRQFEEKDISFLKEIATALTVESGVVALLTSVKSGEPSLVFARSDDMDIDVSALLKIVLNEIGGKGGGRPNLAQGGGGEETGLSSALHNAICSLT